MRHRLQKPSHILSRTNALLALLIAILVGTNAAALESAPPSNPQKLPANRPVAALAKFLQTFCIDCHSGAEPAGDREFDSLDLMASGFDQQLPLQDAIDQLTLGTMPPKDAEQPSAAERATAIGHLTNILSAMRKESTGTAAKTVLRRLSKREYLRTVSSLLGIETTMFDPTIEFPSENVSGHFDNIGNSLVMSGHLLENYLAAADSCVNKAFAVTTKPKPQTWTFDDKFLQQPQLDEAHRRAFKNNFLCLYDHPFNDKIEGGYGHISKFKSGVPVDGMYEIRVLACAMNRDTPYSKRSLLLDLDEPFRMGIRPGKTSLRDMHSRHPLQPKLAEAVIADNDFRWYTFQVPLDQGFAPRFTFENGHHDFRGMIGRLYRYDKDQLPKGALPDSKGIFYRRIALIAHANLPHIRIDKIEIRGPIDYPWPSRSRELLLGGAELEESKAENLIERFASRAFRRPASKEEIEGLVTFYNSQRDGGILAEQAFKNTLKAVMCSPGFLYLQQPESNGAVAESLTDHALAERLSYFLTSTMPDDHLRELADQGQLSDPGTLRSEVKRLLASNASDAFVTDFLESWLNLRELGSMPPDANAFRIYYAADLQNDMKRESQLFFRDLIERNAPVTEFISADHSFINRDLAKLYGIVDRVPVEAASEFRRVSFNDNRRGGLLGQASILTVSANGIDTSPIVRGVWMLENILGTPTPPPPDNVPALEPDMRGALTIRDQLTKHREDEACFKCHRKIDPLGFALEGFDAIGQSRGFYDNKGKRPIETFGELPGGERFSGIADLKKILLKRKIFFVRTVTERLLTHALGRRIEPTDRASVDQTLATVAGQDYPLSSLIEAIVLSDLFTH